jgi:hypothetical protein
MRAPGDRRGKPIHHLVEHLLRSPRALYPTADIIDSKLMIITGNLIIMEEDLETLSCSVVGHCPTTQIALVFQENAFAPMTTGGEPQKSSPRLS